MRSGVWTFDLASPASFKRPTPFINPICLDNQPEKNKESRNEIKLPTYCSILPWPTYTEPRPKRRRLTT